MLFDSQRWSWPRLDSWRRSGSSQRAARARVCVCECGRRAGCSPSSSERARGLLFCAQLPAGREAVRQHGLERSAHTWIIHSVRLGDGARGQHGLGFAETAWQRPALRGTGNPDPLARFFVFLLFPFNWFVYFARARDVRWSAVRRRGSGPLCEHSGRRFLLRWQVGGVPNGRWSSSCCSMWEAFMTSDLSSSLLFLTNPTCSLSATCAAKVDISAASKIVSPEH